MKKLACTLLIGMVLSLGSLTGCGDIADVDVEQQESALTTGCLVDKVEFGIKYSQTNPVWALTPLGNSTIPIGLKGGVITSLATTFASQWSMFTTTPSSLNTAAKAAGCFGPAGNGNDAVNVACAINSLGGVQHLAVPLKNTPESTAMFKVKTAICAKLPVLVNLTGFDNPAMLVYRYNGGDPNSLTSYVAVDPKGAAPRNLYGFTPTSWFRLQ